MESIILFEILQLTKEQNSVSGIRIILLVRDHFRWYCGPSTLHFTLIGAHGRPVHSNLVNRFTSGTELASLHLEFCRNIQRIRIHPKGVSFSRNVLRGQLDSRAGMKMKTVMECCISMQRQITNDFLQILISPIEIAAL